MQPQPPTAFPESLSGLIERVTYWNEENGFVVFQVKARGHRDLVTVVGSLPSVHPGEWITAQGRWIQDRQYGQQCKAELLTSTAPTTHEGIEKYLGSGMVKGIGPGYAKKLVGKFGEKIFNGIETCSARLEEIDGIGPTRRKRRSTGSGKDKSPGKRGSCMSHAMLERLLQRQEPPKTRVKLPVEQSLNPYTSDNCWTVLEPPNLTISELWGDLSKTWQAELRGLPWWRKLPYAGLRIIQNVAYRSGYGDDRLRAQLPPPVSPDFTFAEKNLEQLSPADRMPWLLQFYCNLNNPTSVPDVPMPKSVVLELSANCNLNCVGCGQGRHGIEPSRFLPIIKLHSWAGEACQRTTLIRINGLGESTLHPEFAECLDILRHYPGGREIISNLTAPAEVYERLLDDGFALLLSWDAADSETMARIRRGADYHEMCRKLLRIARKAEHNHCMPPVLLFTFREENMSHLGPVVRHAGETGHVRVTVNMFKRPDNHDWTAHHRQRITEVFAEAQETALRQGVDLALPDHLGDVPVQLASTRPCPGSSCTFPSEQVVIRHNGDVTPCNMLNPYLYGNLHRRSFACIWNGAEAKLFRNSCGRHPYCRQCYYVDACTPVNCISGGPVLCRHQN